MTSEESAAGFIEARKDWFEVRTFARPGGGWDVWLRIDGTYYVESWTARDEAIAHFTRQLDEIIANETP